MELYIVQFYDDNGTPATHSELYTSYKAAKHRYDLLANSLNKYSWVRLCDTTTRSGRILRNDTIERCNVCKGNDDYYHGDEEDF